MRNNYWPGSAFRFESGNYLKMLVQAVGVPIFQLDDALALRGRLRLFHPWNTDSRTFGHAAVEAVPDPRQHVLLSSTVSPLLLPSSKTDSLRGNGRASFTSRGFATADNELFRSRGPSPSRK